jgi:hypothetical protein
MALAPGSDVDFIFVVADTCDELLNGGALSTARLSSGFQSGILEVISAAPEGS